MASDKSSTSSLKSLFSRKDKSSRSKSAVDQKTLFQEKKLRTEAAFAYFTMK
jgi:hypothetical protein